MPGIAFFQIPVNLLYGMIHTTVVHTDNLIFFKIPLHGFADRSQEFPDIFLIIMQIQHTGHKILFLILYDFFLHNCFLFCFSVILSGQSKKGSRSYTVLILPDNTLIKAGSVESARITVGLESSISEALRIGFMENNDFS